MNKKYRSLGRKHREWSHKSWNIINKRKMMKENRLSRQNSWEVRKAAVEWSRLKKEMVA